MQWDYSVIFNLLLPRWLFCVLHICRGLLGAVLELQLFANELWSSERSRTGAQEAGQNPAVLCTALFHPPTTTKAPNELVGVGSHQTSSAGSFCQWAVTGDGENRCLYLCSAALFVFCCLYLYSAPTARQGFIRQEQSTPHHPNRLLIRRTSSHPCSWRELLVGKRLRNERAKEVM